MKKGLFFAILILVCASLFAAPTKIDDRFATDSTYINVPILKTFDQLKGYVVMYQRVNNRVGQAVIPKEWFKKGEDCKAAIRTCPTSIQPYMTVIYKDNEFQKIVLNMPLSRNHISWGVIPGESPLTENMNTETLDIRY